MKIFRCRNYKFIDTTDIFLLIVNAYIQSDIINIGSKIFCFIRTIITTTHIKNSSFVNN